MVNVKHKYGYFQAASRLVFSLTLCCLSTFLLAQHGTIDTDFGVAGNLIIDIDELDECVGIESDPYGNYLFFGQSAAYISSTFPFDIVVGKLRPNGDLDSTFGVNGIYRDNFPGFTICNIRDIVVDYSGIYVLGSGVNPMVADTNEVFVAKLDHTGTLDTSFGDSGFYSPRLLSSYNTAGGITIDSDDNVVFVGSTTEQTLALEYPYIARISKAGIPDSSFGSTGVIAWDYFADSLIDADSFGTSGFERHGEGGYLTQVVEVGSSYFVSGYVLDSFNARALTAMFRKDGTFNVNYNSTGYLVYEPEPGYNFFSNSVQKVDDKFYIALETNGYLNEDNLLIQPVDTNGVLDSVRIYTHTDMTCKAKYFIRRNGYFYLGGYMKDESSTSPGYDSDRFLVMRLDNTGSVEPTFAASGNYIADMGTGDELGLEEMATQGNQMVMAGYVNNIVPGNYVDFAFSAITYDDAIGITEKHKNTLTVYPNPAHVTFHISGAVDIDRIDIYGLDGQLIEVYYGREGDISNLTSGTYLLHITTDQGVYVKKLIRD